MNADPNPYSPPTEAAADPVVPPPPAERGSKVNLLVAWPVVLGVNLLVPLLFAAELLGPRGWSGVLVAVALFLVGGWWLCLAHSGIAKRLLVGSGVVAFSQFLPILHLIAGVIAVEVGLFLEVISSQGDNAIGPEIKTFLGGMLVTTLTGLILAVVALIIGSLLMLIVGLGKRVNGQDSRTR